MNKLNSLKVPAIVTEMSDKVDGFDVAVPFAQGVDVAEMTVGDDNPLFVTVEVLSPQISANKRHWTEESLYEVAEQINDIKPDAYQGHIKEEDRAFASPNSQTIWLGAVVKKMQGVNRLFAKGYVLPYADKLKTYLKSSKAASKKISVSVYGKAHQAWNTAKQAYDISGFKLESIDWARAGSEGVKGAGYFSLTSEMKGENIMDRLEVIKSLTKDEIKANNPSVISEMEEEAGEVAKEEAKVDIEKAEEEGKEGKEDVAEMTEIRKTLKTKKGKSVEVISEMQKELGQSNDKVVGIYIDSELKSKISNSDIASFTKKLVVAEMANLDVTNDDMNRQRFGGLSRGEIKANKAIEAVISSPEAKTLISEMGRSNVINPVVDNKNKPGKRQFTVIN